MEKGYTQFRILGALGGRIDHQYGNFSVLQFIAEHGGSATLEDGSTIVALRRSGDAPFLLEKQKGRTVSVFPWCAKMRCKLYRLTVSASTRRFGYRCAIGRKQCGNGGRCLYYNRKRNRCDYGGRRIEESSRAIGCFFFLQKTIT